MDIIKKGFGERLKTFRKIKNMTQEKLAERIGINLRQLARIEAGESFVSSETLLNICTILEIPPSVLFDYDIDDGVLMSENIDKVHFNVIRSGSIVKLIPQVEQKDKSTEISKDFNKKIQNMAERCGKEIFINELEDGISVSQKVFKPTGEMETIIQNSINKDYEKLKENISTISDDKKKIEFMNLAFCALQSVDALNELKILIKGIELTIA